MDKTEQRKEKIKAWLKNPYNLALIGILFLAFVIRLYYFFLTKTQPLWWDEAEYALKAKSFAFGTPTTGWAPEREIIVPLLFSIVLKLGLGEIGLRFSQFLISFITIFLTYIMASKYLGNKRAILASFMMSAFWLHLFFSQRILLYLWAPLVFLLMAITFYKGYFENSKRWLYVFGAVSSLSLQIYFSSGFFLFGIFIFLLISEKSNLLKRKDLWITLSIFVLLFAPYAIYSQLTFGFPIPRLAVGAHAVVAEYGPGIKAIFGFLTMMPRLIGGSATFLFALAALFFIIDLFLTGDINLKKKDKTFLSRVFIFFGFFWTILFYTIFAIRAGSPAGEGFYDAFILSTFPFIFSFISDFLFNVKDFLNKYHKHLFSILIIVFLVLFFYYNLSTANLSIKTKISSYDSVKFAGLWIKQNSNPQDVVISASTPQNTYYSERATYSPNQFKEKPSFEANISLLKPKFFIVSIFEKMPDWAYTYPQENNLTAVQAYFLDPQRKQASLIIYELKS